MSAAAEQALETLAFIAARREVYRNVNDRLRALQGDFSCHHFPMDEATESSVVKLLDAVLGDELASYLLYDASPIGRGMIHLADGRQFPMNSVTDIRKYLTR